MPSRLRDDQAMVRLSIMSSPRAFIASSVATFAEFWAWLFGAYDQPAFLPAG